MKCPQCSENHKKSQGMQCRCGYRFVFHPTEDGMTDGRFLAAVRRASTNGMTYFTRNQLYTALCKLRGNRKKIVGCLGLFVLFVVLTQIPSFTPKAFWILGSIVGVVALLWLRYRPDPVTKSQFDSWLGKWDSRGKKDHLQKLVRKPRLSSPPPDYPEPDVYDYGFEKLLVVDDNILVDVLVLNGFHARERTLVVSRDGYPSYLQKKAIQALEESPGLPVYFLHAASRESVERPRWLPGEASRRLVDLGLFPEDVKRIKKLRHLKPERHDYELPVDMLPYGALAGLLTPALTGAVSLGEVLAEQQRGTMDISMSYG